MTNARNPLSLYELENEVSVYAHLMEVQGQVIPHLLWHGYLDDEKWYGIATTLCVPKHDATEEEKRRVLERLSQMGVAHEDGHFRDANFVRSLQGQLFAIDFGRCTILTEKSSQKLEKD